MRSARAALLTHDGRTPKRAATCSTVSNERPSSIRCSRVLAALGPGAFMGSETVKRSSRPPEFRRSRSRLGLERCLGASRTHQLLCDRTVVHLVCVRADGVCGRMVSARADGVWVAVVGLGFWVGGESVRGWACWRGAVG